MSYILEKLLHKVNQEYFNFSDLPTICISKGQEKSNRKAIIFGTYNAKTNEIRIHPTLLQEESVAIEFVIYHELLHYQDRDELLGRKKGDRVHTKAFKQREQAFLGYETAQKILKKYVEQGNDIPKKQTQKSSGLKGEALANALADSLQRLDHIMIKYSMIEEKKGAKRGTKKKNDEN